MSYCIGLRIADTHEAMRTVKSCNEMVVCGHPHPPKYNRQSLPPGQKEDSMDSHEIIMRGLLLQAMPLKNTPTKRKKEKYQKKEKKTYNNFILIINNHQQ